jgi:sugar lactone lactonase YvrE
MTRSTERAQIAALLSLTLAAGVLACDQRVRPEEQNPRFGADPAQRRVESELSNANARAKVKMAEDERERRALPSVRPAGQLEVVAVFNGAMPTGVTVSHTGRIFVNFPRWGDPVDFTVAELKNGRTDPYPDAEINRWSGAGAGASAEKSFVSVQSVVVDPIDRLWVLDTGSVKMEGTVPGGPKLVGIDLKTNAVFKTIGFPPQVALRTTYLNDVRFDLRRGKAGMAFITDSSRAGPNAIIVVDLDSGRAWRRLNDHPSTKADKAFLPIVEGRPLVSELPGKPAKPLGIGVDGIALGQDGRRLFYCPLSSRRLYSVSMDALADPKLPDRAVAATVQDLGEKGAADGLEADAQGRLYVTNYENNAVLRRKPDGSYETVVFDPRALWPDTLSVAKDGYLYFIANQLHRQPQYQRGSDLRQKPYELFRVRIDGTPVLLSK